MAIRNFTRLAVSVPAVWALSLVSPSLVDAQRSVFRSRVDVVTLTVTVTDALGKYKTGLTENDFAVFEDGVQQKLSFFASASVPVDVAFVIDASASMHHHLPLIKEAARGLIRRLRDGDRGAVLDVKDAVRLPQPFTGDHALVEAAIDALRASGSTALYDGVYTALREFERERRRYPEVRRHVLVLLSDGLDNASHVTFDAATDLARRLDVSIYTIALKDTAALTAARQRGREVLQAAYAMRALATEAGGRAFFPAAADELSTIYSAIGQELACQYQLGYVPGKPGGDGAFRRVSVRILPPTKATARTRSGYLAVSTLAPARGT